MTATVSETVARPVRGLGQGGAGWVVVEAIEAFNFYDFTDKQYGLAVIVVGAVISAIQNAIENKLGKGILRQVPPREAPVLDTSGDGGDQTTEDEGGADVEEDAPEGSEEDVTNPLHVEDDDPLDHIGEDVEDDLTQLADAEEGK